MSKPTPQMPTDNRDASPGTIPIEIPIGLAFISFAVLLLEIVWMRVLSVTLWYHFAFFALSSALFGLGAAGIAVALRYPDRVPTRLFATGCAAATPVAIVLGYWVTNAVPFEPVSLATQPIQTVYFGIFFLFCALPFFVAGSAISAQAARYSAQFHRLYLADLLGAGAGAVCAVWVLPRFGGSGSILFAAATAAVGAAFLLRDKERAGAYRAAIAGAVAVGLAVGAIHGDRLLPVRISSDKVTGDGIPLDALFRDPAHHRYTAWNTAARVDVVEWQDAEKRPLRAIFLDGGAALTRLIRLDRDMATLKPGGDEESFFYRLFSAPRTLVVGSGGGREVLWALRNGAPKIDAVEINPDINDIVSNRMADFIGYIFEAAPVTLYTDEARSFLERHDAQYDLIHCPHTISNAALASGSLALAENYLLTTEAFTQYLDKLSPEGVLLMTRPEAQLPRLIATLRAAGADRYKARDFLASRLIAWRATGRGSSFYAGIAFRKRPFSADDSARFAETAARRRLTVLFRPGGEADNLYARLAAGVSIEKLPLSQEIILTPSTDDKPFFNRRIPLSALTPRDIFAVFSARQRSRDALEDRPVTEAALIVLLLETALLGLAVVLVPLRRLRRRTGRSLPRGAATAFLFLGVAYIFVEIGFVQRLTLYLGRPTVVFSTVFAVLLSASGIGAAVSGRYWSHRSPRLFAAGAAISATVALLILPLVVSATLKSPLPVRIALTAALLALPGFCMGTPFPALIRKLGRTAPERVPLGWGINGFASVSAAVLAVLIAMTLGQTALLLLGALCYLAAAFFAGTDSR